MIIPSIDLMNGKAVQLERGRKKVIERSDIFAIADDFSRFGQLAVIDLDAAMGKGDNIDIVKKLCAQYDCRVGGGIRSVERAQELLAAGARKIIIGTMAEKEFLCKLPKDRVIVALDSKGDSVVTNGWTKKTGAGPVARARELEDYCSEFLFTKVDREGLMRGVDFEAIKELKNATENKITAAGGITTVDDVVALEEMNVNSQIGMSIYTKKLNLVNAFISSLCFNDGLIPTIVQDADSKEVLMLSYSNKRSIRETFRTAQAHYFSRSRKELWRKGETSGNTQRFVCALYDCDRDALLYLVEQKGNACHTSACNCFNLRAEEDVLQELWAIIRDRTENKRPGSYTNELLFDKAKLRAKILEEARELADSKKIYGKDGIIWESSDLLYHIMVLLAERRVEFKDVMNELKKRRNQTCTKITT